MERALFESTFICAFMRYYLSTDYKKSVKEDKFCVIKLN